MANIAGLVGLNMIVGFGDGTDTAAYRVATGTIPWRVLEDSVHVALFAFQGGVDASGQESRFRVVERSGGRWCRLRKRSDEQKCACQQGWGNSTGILCNQVQHKYSPKFLFASTNISLVFVLVLFADTE
ncbi:MAG: hypothetical protein KKH12_10990 [Gammaproteobacteria bacterium]|nr:hypothetical protein [Gammaproteobacteria bacterium]MBU1482183.1 hypothetical protein [Gammaproteobacteria bacterium]